MKSLHFGDFINFMIRFLPTLLGVWSALALPIALATPSAAIAQTAADRIWTCQLLSDLGSELAHTNAGIVHARDFARNNGADWSIFDAFQAHLDTNPDPRWQSALEALESGMIREAWDAWNEGGSVACADRLDAEWVDATAFRREAAATARDIARRGRLSPRHPDYIPDVSYGVCGTHAPGRPTPILIETSRPVFDSYGHKALVVENTEYAPSVVSIFIYENGHWVRMASRIWTMC